MELKRKKTTKILIIIFAVALLIEIGYAILSTTLRINGNAKISRAGWDVHFENIKVASGSITADTEATIDEAKTTVNYIVTLAKPGDFYEFTVDAVNDGTIGAMISTIANTPLTTEQPKYLAYTVTYSDGTAIAQKQLLAQQKTETFKVRVEFKKDIEAADLPTTPQTLPLTFSANYVQADSTAVAVDHTVCKRATTLHTETCNSGADAGCLAAGIAQGTEITYGNLGATGVALAAGDALDCDVNGDGTFDAAAERFYYVSDLDTNREYAVLVYYNNVALGAPNNTALFAYDSDNTPRVNGPKTAVEQLPTTEQWSKVSLASTARTIKDEKNNEFIDFDYAGRSARLLTTQEVEAACGIIVGGYVEGELDDCKYLMENTAYTTLSLTYGYWLESTYSTDDSAAWGVESSDGRAVGINYASTAVCFGTRPAIEVLKSKIAS